MVVCGARRRAHVFLLVSFAMVLAACEAKLDLSKPRKEEGRPLHRYDELMAGVSVARNSDAGRTSDVGAAAVVVGRGGAVVLVDDRGVPYRRLELPFAYPGASLIDITQCPNGTLAALDFYRAVWTAADPTGPWHRHALPSDEDPAAITCDPRGRLWVTASFTTIMDSADQGRHWRVRSLEEDAILTYIRFFDAEEAVMLGEFGLVYHSADGGESWQSADPIPGEFYPAAAYFPDSAHGWVGGLDGVIYATGDGGRHWQRQPTPSRSPIFRIFSSDLSVSPKSPALFAVGDNGTLLGFRNGRWSVVTDGALSHDYLRVGVVLPGDTVLVGGGRGVLRAVHPSFPSPRKESADRSAKASARSDEKEDGRSDAARGSDEARNEPASATER